MQKMVAEALAILQALGVPASDLTSRRQERMAKAFMSVAGLKPGMKWAEIKDNNDEHRLLSRQIITHMNSYWGENISSGSYDDIRRKDMALPVAALVVLKSAKNPNANTNDGTRGFAIHPAAAKAIRKYGDVGWQQAVEEFHRDQPTLASRLSRVRDLARVPVQINSKVKLTFSAGKHNDLQKEIIESFLPIYGHGAEVLYVGDTAKKNLFLDENGLKKINFFELAHDKLPDVVAYSAKKNWLYLIEAVTTANPITELRRSDLLSAASECTASLIFVTAFLDRDTYRKFAKDIAWETEVWIADAPEHMIHFNGDKFLGPHP
ncbi:MAG: BsuBI/PstI family type II restriction endonuclease [Simplicispira sp.]|uniref:BsuBI/PstI family type II restriction endonuclease n=1 Tax=Simplicispira sp. TaxID=2015802 RepID=UPI00258C6A4B|nr:BsuBI/PstI family type II restriction endonuclease [Simplicispira sp.]MDD2692391.1 BsuBI/PstI family type II restriction endonuclease [Simplicispira sp.]